MSEVLTASASSLTDSGVMSAGQEDQITFANDLQVGFVTCVLLSFVFVQRPSGDSELTRQVFKKWAPTLMF